MDFPTSPVTPLFIPNLSRYTAGFEVTRYLGAAMNALTWPTANKALYIPFTIPFPYSVRRVWWHNGSSVTSTNFDFGIYTVSGTRLYSTGSTAASGTNTLQFVSPTEFLLSPGRYFMAIACSSVTASRGGTGLTGLTAARNRMSGLLEEAAALPLPATMTPVACTFTIMPCCGFTQTASGF